MRYLDPKNDLTFKKIFAEHPHLLISFLNGVLPLEEDQKIESIEYLPTELVPVVPLFKYSIVDVRCRDVKGRQFIVEMQMLWTDSFQNRVLFNASKAYIRQLEKGEQYHLLQPVYALSLVNQNFVDGSDNYYHHYKIVTVGEPRLQMDGLEFIFVELPKVKAQNLKERALGILWLRFMSEVDIRMQQISKDFFENPDIRQALELLKESAYTKEELEAYDRYWDSVRVEKALMMDSLNKGFKQGMEKGLEEGIQKGIQKGIKEGIKEGIQKGIQKGMHEGLEKGLEEGILKGKLEEKINVAKNLLSIGLSVSQISMVSGLSESEVEGLKAQK